MNSKATPGVAAIVKARNRRLVGSANAPGEARVEAASQFPAGCAAKLMTAILILEQSLAGGLDLDMPIGELLPEIEGGNQPASSPIRALLSHTSGIREPIIGPADQAFSWEEFVSAFRSGQKGTLPGEVWSFSHAGYVLLGAALSRKLGVPYPQLIYDRFFRRLQHWEFSHRSDGGGEAAVGHKWLVNGGLSVISQAADLGVFELTSSRLTLSLSGMMELLQYATTGASSAFETPLSPDVVHLLRQTVVEMPPILRSRFAPTTWDSFGLGLGSSGAVCGWSSTGDGTTVSIRADLKNKVTASAGFTVSNQSICDYLATNLLRAPLNQPLDKETASSIPVPFAVGDLLGLYTPLAPTGMAMLGMGGDRNEIVLNMGAGPEWRATAKLTLSDDGRLSIRSAPPAFSLALGKRPESGDPVLLISNCAYLKAAGANRMRPKLPT